jgi:hypothetical protein
MRIVPPRFSGFACQQRLAPNGECFDGVVRYLDGVPREMFVPVKGVKPAALYRELKANRSTIGLVARTVQLS